MPIVRSQFYRKLSLSVPASIVHLLSARRRRSHFLERLRAGRLDQLAGIIGNRDPFTGSDALFQAVDLLMREGLTHRLPELAMLARTSTPFAACIWRALCLWHEGAEVQAIEALQRISGDMAFNGYERRGARAWALYLRCRRFVAVTPGAPVALMQFWDTDKPPSDVSAEMQVWQDLAGPAYTRLSLETARDLFREQFGSASVALYDKCPHPAVQSDLARLGWLLVNGGIYVDADARMRPDFAEIYPCLAGRTVLWFRTRSAALSVANGFIAAPAGAPIVREAFQEACRRIGSGREHHVFDYAGPNLWTEMALKNAEAGCLRNACALSDGEVARNVLGQINARYKAGAKNWRLWMQESGHASH